MAHCKAPCRTARGTTFCNDGGCKTIRMVPCMECMAVHTVWNTLNACKYRYTSDCRADSSQHRVCCNCVHKSVSSHISLCMPCVYVLACILRMFLGIGDYNSVRHRTASDIGTAVFLRMDPKFGSACNRVRKPSVHTQVVLHSEPTPHTSGCTQHNKQWCTCGHIVAICCKDSCTLNDKASHRTPLAQSAHTCLSVSAPSLDSFHIYQSKAWGKDVDKAGSYCIFSYTDMFQDPRGKACVQSAHSEAVSFQHVSYNHHIPHNTALYTYGPLCSQQSFWYKAWYTGILDDRGHPIYGTSVHNCGHMAGDLHKDTNS